MKTYPTSVINQQLQDKLTIIIPTHERHFHLRRILDHFAELLCPIIVADSSSSSLGDSFILSPNVTYLHLPSLSFLQKLLYCVHLVDTPYLMLHADDDFVLLSSLPLCVDFLEINQDYSCVQGHCLGFLEKSENVYQWSPILYETLIYKNLSDDPTVRLKYTFLFHCPLLYAVTRSDVMRIIADSISRCVHNSINAFAEEWLLQFGYSLYGKNKFLPILYMLRQQKESSYKEPRQQAIDEIRKKAPFPIWYQTAIQIDSSTELFTDYTSWVNAMVLMLKRSSVTEVDHQKIIQECAKNLINFYRMHYMRCSEQDWMDYLSIWGDCHTQLSHLEGVCQNESGLLDILSNHVDRRFQRIDSGVLPSEFAKIIETLKKHCNCSLYL
jgi:glycosyltransferase domain-containing protein